MNSTFTLALVSWCLAQASIGQTLSVFELYQKYGENNPVHINAQKNTGTVIHVMGGNGTLSFLESQDTHFSVEGSVTFQKENIDGGTPHIRTHTEKLSIPATPETVKFPTKKGTVLPQVGQTLDRIVEVKHQFQGGPGSLRFTQKGKVLSINKEASTITIAWEQAKPQIPKNTPSLSYLFNDARAQIKGNPSPRLTAPIPEKPLNTPGEITAENLRRINPEADGPLKTFGKPSISNRIIEACQPVTQSAGNLMTKLGRWIKTGARCAPLIGTLHDFLDLQDPDNDFMQGFRTDFTDGALFRTDRIRWKQMPTIDLAPFPYAQVIEFKTTKGKPYLKIKLWSEKQYSKDNPLKPFGAGRSVTLTLYSEGDGSYCPES